MTAPPSTESILEPVFRIALQEIEVDELIAKGIVPYLVAQFRWKSEVEGSL
jgi:hypothetical protein